MTETFDVEANVPPDDVQCSLGRAREVDPTCQEAAIRSYVREMAEATMILDTVDLSDTGPDVSFSASWRDVPRR